MNDLEHFPRWLNRCEQITDWWSAIASSSAAGKPTLDIVNLNGKRSNSRNNRPCPEADRHPPRRSRFHNFGHASSKSPDRQLQRL